jgi:hypothetical protein
VRERREGWRVRDAISKEWLWGRDDDCMARHDEYE